MWRLLRIMAWFVGSVVGLTAAYFGAAFGLAYIPVNGDFEPEEDGIEIAIISNGIHASFVMPVRTLDIDWMEVFPPAEFPVPYPDAPLVAFGWGNREFYLNTPTWDDFDPAIGFRAVVGIGGTAMQVIYVSRLLDNDNVVRLRISEAAYRSLAAHIMATAETGPDGDVVPIRGYSYAGTDAFFEAHGTYNMFVTCNEWVRRGLANAGIRTSLWSPFPGPLLDQLR